MKRKEEELPLPPFLFPPPFAPKNFPLSLIGVSSSLKWRQRKKKKEEEEEEK